MRALSIFLLLIAVTVPLASSEVMRPEIYWRVERQARPGETLVVAFFLGSIEPATGSPRPVPDATYSAHLIGGARTQPVTVEVRGGVAYALVPVPLEMLLGGSLTLNLTASSEMYGTALHKVVRVGVEPDLVALGVLASVAVPFLVPLLFAVVRRR
ncbi:MAG: hypothetical protein QXP81_10600 [Nitrososphaerota archaeon]